MLQQNRLKKNCCEKCQIYWTCELKWYRGEQDQENICCEMCHFYPSCWQVPSPFVGKNSR